LVKVVRVLKEVVMVVQAEMVVKAMMVLVLQLATEMQAIVLGVVAAIRGETELRRVAV
jgi:hypothetical protein